MGAFFIGAQEGSRYNRFWALSKGVSMSSVGGLFPPQGEHLGRLWVLAWAEARRMPGERRWGEHDKREGVEQGKRRGGSCVLLPFTLLLGSLRGEYRDGNGVTRMILGRT